MSPKTFQYELKDKQGQLGDGYSEKIAIIMHLLIIFKDRSFIFESNLTKRII